MTDFFDWLSATDAGALAERLAGEFRLSQEEMRRTADALLPAFLLGFQRAMADGAAWSRLVQSAAPWLPAGTGAGSPQFPSLGDAFTRNLFGSELPAAIARQASLLTGLSPDAIERMMPALGVLTFQSMLQTMTSGTGTGAYPGDLAGQALAEAMRRSANAVEAFHRPSGGDARSPAPMQNLFADALRGFPWMGAAPRPAPGIAADPFAYLSAWTQGWSQMASIAASAGESPPEPTLRGAAPAFPFAGVFADAQSRQADYMREMLALFERHGSAASPPR